MGKNKKLAYSVALQLISMCSGDANLSMRAQAVKNEFDRVDLVDGMVSNQQQQLLNKVLHTTRAMDTGMRTFLEINELIPSGHSMGDYLSDLRKGKAGKFGRLNGNISKRIQEKVVDKRNRYMHAAGTFPSKGEADQIAEDVASYLQTIINLAG